MEKLTGFICLSDIPRELIYTAENGKKYLSLIIGERREASEKGYTHYLKAQCRAEERREGVNYYIGSFKPSKFNDEAKNGEPNLGAPESDGLPF